MCFFSTHAGNSRQRRQQELLSSEDVYIIEPLVEVAGSLEVTIVVGGTKNQSVLIRDSALVPLLESQGNVLADELKDKVITTALELLYCSQKLTIM